MVQSKILFTSQQIQLRVEELAGQMAKDYKGKHLVIVCILNGAYMFTSDLSKALWNKGMTQFEIDFVRISSYGSGTKSSGKPQMTKDIEVSLSGKDVLVIDDIIETGRTLKFFVGHLLSKNPSSVKICTLLSKPKRELNIEPDFIGFDVLADDWVEGYGLDTASFGRGRSDIIKKI
jgi:hypoxanthine phosphoribosyltransferase